MTVKENSKKIAEDSERIAKLETVIPFIKEDISEIKDNIKCIKNKLIEQKKLKIIYGSSLTAFFVAVGYAIKWFMG